MLAPRRPTLSSFRPALAPGKSFSTRKADRPLAPSPVRAMTTHISEWWELVMKHLRPLRIYSSPFFSAVVCIPATSEPPEGSVTATTPRLSPLAKGGRYFFFCSSVPLVIRA